MTTTPPALFDTMAQTVAQDCDRRLEEARQEAERVLAEGRRAADEEYARGVEATQAEIDLADRRERQRLEAEANKATRAVQHRVVAEVLGQVGQELARIAEGDRFGAIAEALLDEILRATSARSDLVVLAPSAQADHIRWWLETTGRGAMRLQPYPGLKDGVAVQDARRTFRVSNTLSGRFAVIQNDARKRALEGLFGREG